MPKTVDLTPSFRIKTAEQELYTPYVAGELPLGNSIGGLQMFSDALQRGQGDSIFKVTGEGMWLGAADFGSALFKVDLSGNMHATSGVFKGEIQAGSTISTTISADKITGQIVNSQIANIDYGKINNVSISNAVIQDGAITNAKIANLSVDSLKIAGEAITADKIGTGAVTTTKIADATITSAKIASLDAGKITTGTLSAIAISSVTISGSTISGGTIDIGGADSTSFHVDSAGNLWMGHANFVSAPFIITSIGEVSTINDMVVGGVFYGHIIDVDSYIDMNGHDVLETQISFKGWGSGTTAPDHYLLTEDDGSTQRLRIKFANNATQFYFPLNAICTPVQPDQYDPAYFAKYELMTELDESRFKVKYGKDSKVQKEYQGRPISHFPALGNDGTEQQKHTEAMWKRPWLPMRRVPDRLETMGQYPYPPVHSPLIGENESMANIYQLLAHAYNQTQERIDGLVGQVEELTKRLDKLK